MPAIKFGSNLLEKLETEGVIERGSHISYTRTLEEQTLPYLSISPPNLSIMLTPSLTTSVFSEKTLNTLSHLEDYKNRHHRNKKFSIANLSQS